MMNSKQIVSQDEELNVASAEAVFQEAYQPRQPVSYEDVITDLCATLHVKLKGVVREACKSPFWFYLVETEDKSFLLRTKVKYWLTLYTALSSQFILEVRNLEVWAYKGMGWDGIYSF